MRYLKNFFKGLLFFIAIIIAALYITDYDYILKGVRVVYMTGHTTAFIDDYDYFDNATIETTTPQTWPKHKQYNNIVPTERLSSVNSELETIAFLIIKNDSILYEDYATSYSENSKTNSFSMAKSITSALLGKAIQDGYIKSLDQPVSDFFIEFAGSGMTVGDLSSMASGLNWDESYSSPFSLTARSYYDDDLAETILNLKVTEQPGQSFKYLSGNTQLLGMVIQKASGIPLPQYLSDSFWKPMGMEQEALWQLDDDDNKLAKTYCCIASNARDFARFGKLYKDGGSWNGKRLLPKDFVTTSINPRFAQDTEYGYGFWLSNYRDKKIFAMRGILGQYVITIPEDNLIIVRLGHRRGDWVEGKPFTQDFYDYIDAGYEMTQNVD